MKIVYVEIAPSDTFNENGAQLLQQQFPEGEIITPTLPADPTEALSALNMYVKTLKADVVIGVGIGGTLVQALYGQYRILINPVFTLPHCITDVCMSSAEGKRCIAFTPTQQDNIQQFLSKQFKYVPRGEEQYIYGLFAGQDDFLLYSETFFKQNFKYNFNYDGTGLLTTKDWAENVVPLLHMLSDQINNVQKPILYLDMDGVLVDFTGAAAILTEEEKANCKGHLEDVPGIFERMQPMPGAIEAFKQLSRHYDLYILTTAPWDNETAWSGKIKWIKKHLGIYGYKRVVMTHRKDLNEGALLLDDLPKKGSAQFEGTWLQFGKSPVKDWNEAVDYLLSDAPKISNGDTSGAEIFEEDSRPIVYLDMDSVLVDFAGAVKHKLTPEETEKYRDHYDDVPDIFSRMEPVEGAVEAFNYISEHFNTFLLSTAPWDNNNAWSDKVRWVKKHLGEKAKKRLVLSHHKNLNQGSFLIDDSSRNGAKEFCGKWFQFGKAPYENWDKMLSVLKTIDNELKQKT